MHGLQYERPDWGGRTMGPAVGPLTTAGGGWRWSEFSTERMGRFSFKDGRDIRGNAEGGGLRFGMCHVSHRIYMCAVAAVLVDEGITNFNLRSYSFRKYLE